MAVPVSMASSDLKGNRVSVKLQTFLLSDITSHTMHVVNTVRPISRTVLFKKQACESSRLSCSVFSMCLDHSYVEITASSVLW